MWPKCVSSLLIRLFTGCTHSAKKVYVARASQNRNDCRTFTVTMLVVYSQTIV